MKRKLVALMVLLAGLSLAQSTNTHNVTVNIPSILQLTLDATDYLFDFTDTTLTGTETVTVNGTPYTKASRAAYDTFIDTATGTQTFAPTSVAGTGGADYGTVTVRTNRAQWTVKIDSIGGTLTLGNDRVKVFAERVGSSKGASWTTTPTPITAASPLTLFNAGSGGQGKSIYKLYYLLEMNISDDIPLSGINQSITINLLLTSP
ncbi:hypothetical protein [Fervidobacterium sp.]